MKYKNPPKSRSFSKRLTVVSMTGIFAICAFGMYSATADLANILSVLSASTIAHLALYRGVGHLDYRQVIASGLLRMTPTQVTAETLAPLVDGEPLPPVQEDKEEDHGAH